MPRGRQLIKTVNNVKVFKPTKKECEAGWNYKVYAKRIRGNHDTPADNLFKNQKDLQAFCKNGASPALSN